MNTVLDFNALMVLILYRLYIIGNTLIHYYNIAMLWVFAKYIVIIIIIVLNTFLILAKNSASKNIWGEIFYYAQMS